MRRALNSSSENGVQHHPRDCCIQRREHVNIFTVLLTTIDPREQNDDSHYMPLMDDHLVFVNIYGSFSL